MAAVAVVAAGEIKNAANFTPPPPGWSISAGVTVRSIDADFHIARPAPFPTQRFFRSGSSGAGDVGLYTGGAGTVRYSDGSVGPDYGLVHDSNHIATGDAGGLINSASQLTSTGRIDSFDVPIDDLAFHSGETFTRYGSTAALHGLDASDNEVGVGPYITLTYELRHTLKDTLSVSLGWSYVQTHHGLAGQLGVQRIARQTTENRYAYHYDYDGAGGAATPGAAFPFDASVIGEGFIVYDPATYANVAQAGTGYLPPRQSSETSRASAIAGIFVPVATARLRVHLNEVIFATQYQRHLSDRFHVGLSVGPTLNVIGSSLDTTIDWLRDSRSQPVATLTDHRSSTQIKMGIMGQLNASYDLTKRLYLEAHGGFRWVDPVTISGALASVRVNPSSWESGIGIGFRFR